ncbi:MAG: TetR/AcrR family transcriptional regulator [Dermatophilaceae bacterium]
MAGTKGGGSRLDPTVEPRVIDAVLEELATTGRDGLSMDRIAKRAGVSKATMYTRWRSKHELLLAAYRHLAQPFPPVDTGSLSGDIDVLCDIVLAGAEDGRYRSVLTELAAAASTDPTLEPHLHEASTSWRAGLQVMLRAAQDRGELNLDLDIALLAETLTAFTLRRLIFQNPPIDDTIRSALHTLVQQPNRTPQAGG